MNNKENKYLSGMYGEMPIVKIGNIKISQMSNKEGETRIWFDTLDVEGAGEGAEFEGTLLEADLMKIFRKHF